MKKLLLLAWAALLLAPVAQAQVKANKAGRTEVRTEQKVSRAVKPQSATTKAQTCCDKKLKCCSPAQACCSKKHKGKVAKRAQACCKAGKACCQKAGAACCKKKTPKKKSGTKISDLEE